MATLPLARTTTGFSGTSVQPSWTMEQSAFLTPGWTKTIYTFHGSNVAKIVPKSGEVLCVAGNMFTYGNSAKAAIEESGTFFAIIQNYPSTAPDFDWSALHKLAQSWWPQKEKAASGWFEKLDRIVTELGRLNAGWDGDVAPPPSQNLLNEMDRALRALPHNTKEPEVEVDASDGSVATRWWSADSRSSFTMIFTGNGKVYAVSSSADQVPPASWECPFDDETKIDDRIADPLIRRALLEIA